ncbi:CbtA family protein [Deltaproteobacteria bacterium]|nr:CbtA family protein [Deltaproteobacteria bacterium]
MISKAVMTVLLTGFIAGIVVTGAQMLRVTPLILQAETYELSELAVPHNHAASGITHQHKLNGAALDKHLQIKDVHIQTSASTDPEQSWGPADGMERTFYTLVSNIITAIAFSLILVAVYLLRGKPVNYVSGLLWGVAGFAVFSGSIALGLPPELPGMTAAALESRQIWWIGTVIATATGIGLLIESKTILLKLIAAVLIAVPHSIGAPHPHVFESNVPAELSAQFAVASLMTSLFFWMVLGVVSGYFYQKLVLESSRPLETVTV